MVGGAGNAPVVASGEFRDTGFTDRPPGHLPKRVAGAGVAPTSGSPGDFSLCFGRVPRSPVSEDGEWMMEDRPSSILYSLSSLLKWWSRRVTLPHGPACRAGALLVCHDPMENCRLEIAVQLTIGAPPWCCPKPAGFWRPRCASWRTAQSVSAFGRVGLCLLPLVEWCGRRDLHPDILRGGEIFCCPITAAGNREGRERLSSRAPGPCHFNKEQTPLGDLRKANPRFHGGCFGVLGHTSCEALGL
jgi:hypothetical protein